MLTATQWKQRLRKKAFCDDLVASLNVAGGADSELLDAMLTAVTWSCAVRGDGITEDDAVNAADILHQAVHDAECPSIKGDPRLRRLDSCTCHGNDA